MELGVHNGTVAITVGAGIATILASPAAVYSVFMFVTAGLFARMMYKRNEEPGVVSETPLPVPSPAPQPVLVGAGGPAQAVPVAAPVTAVAAAAAAPVAAAERRPTVRAHPGSAFWGAMTLAAVVLTLGSLGLVALAIAGAGV
jgi:hypothetical protein